MYLFNDMFYIIKVYLWVQFSFSFSIGKNCYGSLFESMEI